MEESTTPKVGPNPSDAPTNPDPEVNVFGYDVASQARVGSNPNKPNPSSPLAAG
jgi:hypothetical protein